MILYLAQDMQFLLGGYFASSGYHIKKADSTNQCSVLTLVRNNTHLKTAKNQLTPKFHDGDEMCRSCQSEIKCINIKHYFNTPSKATKPVKSKQWWPKYIHWVSFHIRWAKSSHAVQSSNGHILSNCLNIIIRVENVKLLTMSHERC